MYIVYVLFSSLKDSYYIGYTGDELSERVRKHNTNHRGFTGKTGDWTVVYQESFDNKQAAINREKMVKGWKSRKLIEKLIGLKHPDW